MTKPDGKLYFPSLTDQMGAVAYAKGMFEQAGNTGMRQMSLDTYGQLYNANPFMIDMLSKILNPVDKYGESINYNNGWDDIEM